MIDWSTGQVDLCAGSQVDQCASSSSEALVTGQSIVLTGPGSLDCEDSQSPKVLPQTCKNREEVNKRGGTKSLAIS